MDGGCYNEKAAQQVYGNLLIPVLTDCQTFCMTVACAANRLSEVHGYRQPRGVPSLRVFWEVARPVELRCSRSRSEDLTFSSSTSSGSLPNI